MKVIIELSEKTLEKLGGKAKVAKRSRKNYMEFILTLHAAKVIKRRTKRTAPLSTVHGS